MPDSAPESSSSNRLRKKRPERQLYVPPAQRTQRRLLKENSPQNNEHDENTKTKIVNKKDGSGIDANNHATKEHIENDFKITCKKNTKRLLGDQNISKTAENQLDLNYINVSWEYRISKNSLDIQYQPFYEPSSYPYYFNDCHYPSIYKHVYSYNKSSSNVLYILNKNYVLWQPKIYTNYSTSDINSVNSRTYPLYSFDEFLRSTKADYPVNVSLLSYNLETVYEKVSRFDSAEFKAFKVLWNENRCYCTKNDVIDLSDINGGHIFIVHIKNESDYIYECGEDHSILECYLDKKQTLELGHKSADGIVENKVKQTNTKSIKSGVIILEERSKSLGKNEATVQNNNIKNSTANLYISSNDLIKNVNNNTIIKSPKRSNEHEQEKEIMRKTKKFVNRKTRPIMKYVDNASDKLLIGKNDNVNDWEDLFDDADQLQEELFKEINNKVGTDASLDVTEDDDTYYVPKQSEELEHMVELYDFPPTLATHDIIQSFSDINSDAMYVKWVDDTHAILVLGTLKQAQRAVELNNSLIKVRPMTAASSMALAAACKNDLKPAMKRPPTNLQTARRLITTHLGTRSKVNQEQNAKERDELKAARELKKLARKNEQDAWEGKLRSSVN